MNRYDVYQGHEECHDGKQDNPTAHTDCSRKNRCGDGDKYEKDLNQNTHEDFYSLSPGLVEPEADYVQRVYTDDMNMLIKLYEYLSSHLRMPRIEDDAIDEKSWKK